MNCYHELVSKQHSLSTKTIFYCHFRSWTFGQLAIFCLQHIVKISKDITYYRTKKKSWNRQNASEVYESFI